MEEVWEIMSQQLYFIKIAYGVEIISFVLMGNHFHLLIRTPHANLSEAMGWFMREVSRALTKAAHRINQTWGNRHFRCIISSQHYFLHAYKYAYRNPVEAGLCMRVEEYPFSTLSGLLGQNQLLIPLVEDLTLFSDVEGTLNWLNSKPNHEDWESIRCALKKTNFALRKNPNCNLPNHLEFDLL